MPVIPQIAINPADNKSMVNCCMFALSCNDLILSENMGNSLTIRRESSRINA
mgnify:CR=1 FL=1